MYNNMYPFNPQANVDRINSINNEIANLEMKRTQAMMPQPITQNFQMLNSNSVMRFANNLEEVQRDFVITDTPFFSKDMSVLWVKNVKGEINSYELKEMVEKDEKDLKIDYLMAKIEELEKGINKDEKSNGINDNEPTKNEKPTNVSNVKPRKSKSYGDVEGDGD